MMSVLVFGPLKLYHVVFVPSWSKVRAKPRNRGSRRPGWLLAGAGMAKPRV